MNEKVVPMLSAPFDVDFNHFFKWLDDEHVANYVQNEYKTLVWNISSKQTTYLPFTDIRCIASFDKPEPKIKWAHLKAGPDKYPISVGLSMATLSSFLENPPLGKFSIDHETISPPVDGHRPWAISHPETDCHVVPYPQSTSVTGYRQTNLALFGGRLVVEGGVLNEKRQLPPDSQVQLSFGGRKEPITLPLRYCDITRWTEEFSYYAFKRAYIAWSTEGYNAKLGRCTGWTFGSGPIRYWWLFEDGKLEEGIIPSLGFSNTRSELLTTYLTPTRGGVIYRGLLPTSDPRYLGALYIARGEQWQPLYLARLPLGKPYVSPSGCRIAFREGDDNHGRMRVIDVCTLK